MKHLEIRGRRLEYLDIPAIRDDRPVLLMLHEGLGCVALWRDFPARLAAATGCRTVAWSRSGYGGSAPCSEARTPRYMHIEGEEMLPDFLAALGVEKPLLVGHSDGGSIALIFAGAFPQAALGVAVMAPHEFVEAETLLGIRKARQAWNTTDWPQKLARYHQNASQVFGDWSNTWLSPDFRDWNIEAYLPKISCPVLAIQGEDDEYASLRQIEVIAEQVAGAQILKLAHCGHSPHKDQAEPVLAALVAFVDRVSGSCR